VIEKKRNCTTDLSIYQLEDKGHIRTNRTNKQKYRQTEKQTNRRQINRRKILKIVKIE
jgi:hypothetical protein